MAKIIALVGCQHPSCAEEVSLHLDMVMMWKDQPICQGCYEYDDTYAELDEDGDPKIDWNDLPPVKLSDLSA